MADFDLTQTDAQVQSILNDGQNMQGAGAQTTLTTESVLLKDVNGNYHKILKSSFTEAIRDTLAGLLVNNDKGTTINQIAAIASGDFGSITPANLASVLGVEFVQVNSSNMIDANDFVVAGSNRIAVIRYDDAPQDKHYPYGGYGIMLSVSFEIVGLQIAARATGAIQIRKKWDSWTEWTDIY
jgi:hypothetical protein